MSNIINILHLSDIHYSKRRWDDQKPIAQAFFRDIGKLVDNGVKPDLVIISGDLLDAADEDDYFEFYDNFVQPVLSISKCAESRLILAPGNHDARRSEITQSTTLQSTFCEPSLRDAELNECFRKDEFDNFIRRKFSGFHDLVSVLRGPRCIFASSLAQVYEIEGTEVEVVVINTAWATTAGLNKQRSDQGNLIFPQIALIEALESGSNKNKKILVGHHPTNWLREHSQHFVETQTEGKCIAHLYGHMHDPQPKSIVGLRGSVLWNQSGSLHHRNDRFIGYALMSLDTESQRARFLFRQYSKLQYEFTAAEQLTPGGIFYSDANGAEFWRRKVNLIDRAKLQVWLQQQMKPIIRKELNAGIAAREVSEIFVYPRFQSANVATDSGDLERQLPPNSVLQFDELVSSSENFVIHGQQEHGKTTILNQVALKSLDAGIKVPAIISFSDIRAGKNRVLGAIKAAIPCEPDGFSIEQCLIEGLVTVCIDDVDFANAQSLARLKQFINEYPKNRYIFTTMKGSASRLNVVPDINAVVPFNHVSVLPFTRGQMRSLVEKWDSDGTLDREQILNRVVNEIVQINVPMTAINGTLFLSIFEENSNFTPINRASLIEQFLETVLEKRNLVDVQRRSFDFQHKVHTLSALAYQMAWTDEYVLPYDHVVTAVRQHFDRLGFNWDSRAVVDEFINARVLWVRNDHEVSFRYRAYLEYFIAHRMQTDQPFRDWVLSKEQYLRFTNEIQYYAGSARTDASLLELIGDRFDQLTAKIEKTADWSPDPARLDTYKLLATDSEADIFAEYEEQLAAPPFTPEERDSILEGEIPTDVENRQEVFRPNIVDLGVQWTSALFLYSSLLKNLEIVDDVIKRAHLQRILRGWAILTMQSLAIVPILAKDRQIIINGIRYEVLVSKTMSDKELARFISIDLPNSLSRLLTGFMGTEKLEKQLLEPGIDEASEPKIIQFFRIALIADLRLKDWPSVTKQFSSALRHNDYILEALLRKMREIYLLGGLDGETQKRLQVFLGEGIALLSGVDPAQRTKNKSKRIQSLAKEVLIQRLRRAGKNEDR